MSPLAENAAGFLFYNPMKWIKLRQEGVSIYVVSKLLGHASPKTTEIYAHLAPETYHDAVNLLDMNERKKYTDKAMEAVQSQ